MLADLGFKGWSPENIKLILPHKKPRNTKTEKKELTDEQKTFNRELSKKRVKVDRRSGGKCSGSCKNFTHR